MPLEFKLLQRCRRRKVPPVSIFWHDEEANLHHWLTRVGAAVIHFAQNLFPPTSAVQWRLQLGHTHWWGEGTKAAWPVWKPFNEESVKEMPPCPPPSWLLHTLRESLCMKSPWRSFGWSSLKVWAWGWYEVIDEQILELRASKLICKNGLIRGSVVPS